MISVRAVTQPVAVGWWVGAEAGLRFGRPAHHGLKAHERREELVRVVATAHAHHLDHRAGQLNCARKPCLRASMRCSITVQQPVHLPLLPAFLTSVYPFLKPIVVCGVATAWGALQ